MRTHVTHALTFTFLFHSCVSRARTLRASARSPLGFLYGVCQLATMGFFTQMKGSAQNVCSFNKHLLADFSAIPVLFNEYCTQKVNVDTKSLFVHMIMRSMFAKSAFSFCSALDVLKIKN